MLQHDKSRYADYTGCGNTLNANQPIVRRLIQDSLRYWVSEMHVDGFRFDLASILSRDEAGHPQPNAPVLWDIETDPQLAGTKLIAEAWDAGGLYQVGSFLGDKWQEWNGQFRDDVRRFVKGDAGAVSAMASRILGSPDLFGHEQREAEQSINFVTCHAHADAGASVGYVGRARRVLLHPLVSFDANGRRAPHLDAAQMAAADGIGQRTGRQSREGHDQPAHPVNGGDPGDPVLLGDRFCCRRPRQLRDRPEIKPCPEGRRWHRYAAPWNVRLMTSICCSRVRRTKLTA